MRRAAVEWREGASTVRRSRVLKVLLVFSLITAVGEGIMGTLFTPYVKDILEGNAATLGTVNSAQAVGGILGGFVAAAAGRRWSSRALFGWGAVVFGLDRPGDLRLPRRVRRRVAGRARHGAGRLPRRGDASPRAPRSCRTTAPTSSGAGSSRCSSRSSALSLTVGAVTAGFLGEALGIIEVLALQGGGYVVAGVMVLLLIGPTERPDSTETSAVPLTADL